MPPRLAKGIVEPRIDDKVISNLSSNRHRFPPNRREPGGPMGTKIAVIGAGSTYTPELVDGLARRIDRLPIDELVLLDIEPERLEVVGGLARRMITRAGWPGTLVSTLDRDAVLDGAHFVLIRLMMRDQAARLVDETLPPTVHTSGQEPTGT